MLNKDLQDRIHQWFKRDYRATFLERIELLFKTEKLYQDERPAIAYGHTLKYILDGISKPLDDCELLAGSVVVRVPTKEEEEYIRARYKTWWNIPLEERHEKVFFYYSENWLRCRPYWFISFGHLAFAWEDIISIGLKGLKQKAIEKKKDLLITQEQKDFLDGAILCYNAFRDYMLQYARVADEKNKKELAERLRRVSENAPETFADALQLIWILVLVSQKVCGCGVLNLSRMDQYLLPLYTKDVKEGVLTAEYAKELLDEFFFKNNEIMVQTDHMSIETETTDYTLEVAFDDPNYLTLAGKKSDGTGGVNELSYLMLQSAVDLNLRNPFVVVRYYDGIPEDFWRNVCGAMRDNATVVIYNDETMLSALKKYGAEEPEVYDYGFWGCNDPNIPAYEGGLRQLWFNLAKPLELVLQQGDYPMAPKGKESARECQFSLEDRMVGLMTGPYYGLETKSMSEIKNMSEFLQIYEQQIMYLMSEYRKGFEDDFEKEQCITGGRIRIEDCFLKGTVESAVTWTKGGTKYHKIVAQGCGLATVVDSLYAIEKLVFIDKKYTLEELANILKNNYEGNEDLRLYLKKKIQKFGNDIDEVDKYASIVTDMFIRAIEENNGKEYLYQMWPTYSTDRDFTTMGKYVGATPDGRFAGEKLSENQSPCEGADRCGLTAMLNSLSKIPFHVITGGPLNVRIHPSAIKGEEGLTALCSLFKTYMEKKGMQLQINVVDAETLRKAQEDPDAYRCLCVRVTGYSAFFVEMGKKAQDELIARTEQAI